MSIVKIIDSARDFRIEFEQCGRGDQFSIGGFYAVFEMVNECASDGDYIIDVVGICCEYSEETFKEFFVSRCSINEYKEECRYGGFVTIKDYVIRFAEEHTTAVITDEAIVYCDF